MYGNSKSLTCGTAGRSLRWALFGACAILVAGFGAAHAASPTVYERLTPVSNAELAEMRGGFVLPNGMIIAVEINFHTAVATSNGGGVPFIEENVSLSEDDLYDSSGVVHSVTVEPDGETPDVEISTTVTNEMSGVMNVIQNNANSVAIQNMTTVNVDLMNTGVSLQIFRTNNFSMRMRSLGASGL